MTKRMVVLEQILATVPNFVQFHWTPQFPEAEDEAYSVLN